MRLDLMQRGDAWCMDRAAQQEDWWCQNPDDQTRLLMIRSIIDKREMSSSSNFRRVAIFTLSNSAASRVPQSFRQGYKHAAAEALFHRTRLLDIEDWPVL